MVSTDIRVVMDMSFEEAVQLHTALGELHLGHPTDDHWRALDSQILAAKKALGVKDD